MSEKYIRMLMVLAALCWSGAFIAGKMAVIEFSPMALTFFRFLFALPFIFVILYIREPKNVLPQAKQWWPLFMLGLVGTFGYHALFFTALKYTTAINSSLIGAMNPMVTTVLAALFFHERLSPVRILGIALSFSGVFFVVTNADVQLLSTFRFNHGDLLMATAVCCWAVYSLLGRHYMKKYSLSPLMVTAYTFLICVILSLPFVAAEGLTIYFTQASRGGWLAILYMTVFASVLGYLVQLVAIQRIGATRTAMFINLVPMFTIVQSVLILGEAVSPLKLVGAMTIIMGVYLAIRPETEISSLKLGNNEG